jgi:hypothetical protein
MRSLPQSYLGAVVILLGILLAACATSKSDSDDAFPEDSYWNDELTCRSTPQLDAECQERPECSLGQKPRCQGTAPGPEWNHLIEDKAIQCVCLCPDGPYSQCHSVPSSAP